MTEAFAQTEANRETIRQAFEAWHARTAAITDVFTPEVVWRLEGHSRASGEYASKQQFVDQVLRPFGARFAASGDPSDRLPLAGPLRSCRRGRFRRGDTVKARGLGSDGPRISVVGYGAWEAGGGYYGENPPDEEMIAAMRAGFDAGINWIDTAEAYGAGRSEELVGDAIEGYGDVLVATKVVMRPFGSGLDAAGIQAGADQSRRRLRRDVLDLYQLHLPDPSVPVEESWEAMARLVDGGVVRHIGLSNFPLELVRRCERLRHVDTVQLHFSLLYRDDYRELQPFCEENGIAILAYGPLGFGVLTGTMTTETRFPDDDWRGGGVPVPVPLYEQIFAPRTFERHLAKAAALRPVADRNGLTLAQLALAWVVAQPSVTAAIAGSRSPSRVRENAAAGSTEFTPAQLEEVDAALAGVASA
jgi:methylglyoxal reductase